MLEEKFFPFNHTSQPDQMKKYKIPSKISNEEASIELLVSLLLSLIGKVYLTNVTFVRCTIKRDYKSTSHLEAIRFIIHSLHERILLKRDDPFETIYTFAQEYLKESCIKDLFSRQYPNKLERSQMITFIITSLHKPLITVH